MKKALLALSALLLVFTAFTPAPDQKYKVESTLDYWQRKLNVLETVVQAVKKSNIPSEVSFPLIDSLTVFQQDIVTQVRGQMPTPKDTTNKK